jgi:hypothetical protein
VPVRIRPIARPGCRGRHLQRRGRSSPWVPMPVAISIAARRGAPPLHPPSPPPPWRGCSSKLGWRPRASLGNGGHPPARAMPRRRLHRARRDCPRALLHCRRARTEVALPWVMARPRGQGRVLRSVPRLSSMTGSCFASVNTKIWHR